MCDDPKKRRRKAKIIGAVMATVTGMLMFVLATPLDAYTSWGVKESTAHLITLTICLLLACSLVLLGRNPKTVMSHLFVT
ncbi:adhesion protein [Cutibacterium acnes JCM 18918]|nr:adhesion protein [Cutibacterium acnes JCM 18918]